MPLLVCATPIGNLGDVTQRVLDALRDADAVLCEDTRRTQILLDRYEIRARRLVSLHQHSEARRIAELMPRLSAGETHALVSDAGLPGVNDPGARLVEAAVAEGIPVAVLPGPSAVETALVASGIVAREYRFLGYLPRRDAELDALWEESRTWSYSAVAFESPRRLPRSLARLALRRSRPPRCGVPRADEAPRGGRARNRVGGREPLCRAAPRRGDGRRRCRARARRLARRGRRSGRRSRRRRRIASRRSRCGRTSRARLAEPALPHVARATRLTSSGGRATLPIPRCPRRERRRCHVHRLFVIGALVLAALTLCGPAAGWSWPADGDVVRPFSLGGDAYAAGQHRGVDVGGADGSPVRAPASGTVSFAGSLPTHGRGVTILTADGYAVTLVHLGSIDVEKGASVAEGDAVGTMGSSGTPEHPVPTVHLGIRRADQDEGYIDPLGLLPARPVPAAPGAGARTRSGSRRCSCARGRSGARRRCSAADGCRPTVCGGATSSDCRAGDAGSSRARSGAIGVLRSDADAGLPGSGAVRRGASARRVVACVVAWAFALARRQQRRLCAPPGADGGGADRSDAVDVGWNRPGRSDRRRGRVVGSRSRHAGHRNRPRSSERPPGRRSPRPPDTTRR